MNNLKKHSIKLDDETYRELTEFQVKREPYSLAVFRLLRLYKQLNMMMHDLAKERSTNPEGCPLSAPGQHDTVVVGDYRP